ncbi:MAG: ATP-binding cassette domain-containing protein, partial [bacterium]|nr:ATP-binding cassette domain-containing protein [bacterium]
MTEQTAVANGVVLEAEGLRKAFGRTVALDNVDVELSDGEVLCVIGPNGAGKTTMLLLLGGVLLPDAGTVNVFGMHRWKQSFEIRQRTTFLTAEPVFGASPTPSEFPRFYGDRASVGYGMRVDLGGRRVRKKRTAT